MTLSAYHGDLIFLSWTWCVRTSWSHYDNKIKTFYIRWSIICLSFLASIFLKPILPSGERSTNEEWCLLDHRGGLCKYDLHLPWDVANAFLVSDYWERPHKSRHRTCCERHILGIYCHGTWLTVVQSCLTGHESLRRPLPEEISPRRRKYPSKKIVVYPPVWPMPRPVS